MLAGIGSCLSKKIHTALLVGEDCDSQAVAGVQLMSKETTAGLGHGPQLHQAGSGQERFDVVFTELYVNYKKMRYISSKSFLRKVMRWFHFSLKEVTG